MRSFTYRFETTTGETFEYHHCSDRQAEQCGEPPYPHWTQLEYKQCQGCRWNRSKHCPVAVGLVEPAKLLSKFVSFDEVTVTVIAPERTYSKQCTVQEGVSALFGLIMSTSGCPNFDFLRGLGKYHLPFASYEETLFRVMSAYLLRGYLADEQRLSKEDVTAHIQALYQQIHEVNIGLAQRLRHGFVPESDSPLNAIIILDSIGAMVPISAETGLEDLRGIFL